MKKIVFSLASVSGIRVLLYAKMYLGILSCRKINENGAEKDLKIKKFSNDRFKTFGCKRLKTFLEYISSPSKLNTMCQCTHTLDIFSACEESNKKTSFELIQFGRIPTTYFVRGEIKTQYWCEKKIFSFV